MCEAVAPEVFRVDESDTLVVLPFTETEVERAVLLAAVNNWPKDALSIVDRHILNI